VTGCVLFTYDIYVSGLNIINIDQKVKYVIHFQSLLAILDLLNGVDYSEAEMKINVDEAVSLSAHFQQCIKTCLPLRTALYNTLLYWPNILFFYFYYS
jgi:hypothetical protein